MEQNNEAYYLQLIAKYLSREASEFEKNLLLEWIESSQESKKLFLESQKAWKLTDNNAEVRFDADKAWLKIKPLLAIDKGSTAKERRHKAIPLTRTLFNNYWRIAAMLAIAIGTVLLLWKITNNNTQETISINSGNKKKTIFLPDSSKVYLNRNTSFSYKASFLTDRQVFLTGEAYFEVRKLKGKSFEITTPLALTSVLGTSFNINAKQGSEEIIKVFSGKVAYAKLKNKDKKVFLTKGMQARLSKQLPVMVDTFNILNNVIVWKESQLLFENKTVSEIIATMESYFDIKIKAEDTHILQCKFTGNFSMPAPEEMLKVITVSLNASYTFKNGEYIISGHGCD